MQNWSWSGRGLSPQSPPTLTPLPPARTRCTLRSSSRKNSCKHSSSGQMDVMVPPSEANWTEWQPKDYIYELSVWHLAFVFFGCKYATVQLLVNEGFVFPRRSSIPAQQFLGLIILLFCLLASLACEPDVYRTLLLLTILYKLRRLCGKKPLSRLSYWGIIRHCTTF